MDKRQAIIDSAIKLFSEKGFQATSTTSITKDAGVGTGTLFTYFEHKDDLINTAYLESKAEMADYLKEHVVEGDTVKNTLFSLLKASLFWGLDNQEKFSFLMQFGNSPFISNVTMEKAIGGFHFVVDVMKEGVEKEEIAEIPIDLYHSILGGIILGTFNYIKMANADKDEVIKQTFDILWLGIRK
jgi:AcrR family transcriptional regulator